MSMSNHMNDKEILKLSRQLGFVYGINRRLQVRSSGFICPCMVLIYLRAQAPAHLFLTGVDEEGALFKACVRRNSGFADYVLTRTPLGHTEFFPKHEVTLVTTSPPRPFHTLIPVYRLCT
jgi:hypothetical protein